MYPSMQWARGCIPARNGAAAGTGGCTPPPWTHTPLDRHPLGKHTSDRHTPTPRQIPTPLVQMTIETGGTHPTGMYSCYRPQQSWGKVMFLQASVILLTGGGCVCSWGEGGTSPPQEQTAPRADTPRRACCEIRSTRGRYASYWNAILL